VEVVFAVIAVGAVVLVAVSFPGVLREHREWKKREQTRAAMRKLAATAAECGVALTALGQTALRAAAEVERLGAALAVAQKVDTGRQT